MFSKNIASLRVVLGADTSKFRKGMKQAQKTLKSTGKKMKEFANKAGVSLPLALSAAAAGLTALMVKTAKWGDTIAKSAKQAGVTTEFLSEMEFAADRAGAQLSDVMNGIRRMARAASDASRGMVTYQRAFNELNITVADSHGNLKQTEVLFMEVVDALGHIENSTKRVALAQEIFGRGGMKLLPLLHEDIGALRELAQELGVSLSAERAAEMEDFADAITNLKTSLKGLAIEMTSDNMAWTITTLTRLVELMKEYNKGGLGAAIKYAIGASQMGSRQMPIGIGTGAGGFYGGAVPFDDPRHYIDPSIGGYGAQGRTGFNVPPTGAFVGPPSYFDMMPKRVDTHTGFTAVIEQKIINKALGQTEKLHYSLAQIDTDFAEIGKTVIVSVEQTQEWSNKAHAAAAHVTEGVYALFDALESEDFWDSLWQNTKRYFQMLIAESIRARSYAWFLGMFSKGNAQSTGGGIVSGVGNKSLGTASIGGGSGVTVNLVNNSGMPLDAKASVGQGGSIDVILEGPLKKIFNSGRMDGTMKQFNAYRRVG